MKVYDKNFEDGNIKFTVELNDNESLSSGIRIVEVFNDNFRDEVTYLRPIGFKINGVGTANQLHASEDFTETAIEIIRRLDKHQYRFIDKSYEDLCNQSNYVPSLRIKMAFDKKVVLISDLVNELSSHGIEIKQYFGDEVLIHSLKDSVSIEMVFGLCSSSISHDIAHSICTHNNGTEHYLCNVSTIGGVVYSIEGENKIKVDCDIFVSEPEVVYTRTLDKIKAKLMEF